MKRILTLFTLLSGLAFNALSDDQLVLSLLDIQKQWAHVNYQLEDEAREKAFDMLIAQAQQRVKAVPEDADSLIWLGIIQSSAAGAKGGLGALGLAKDARKSLEAALKIDENALQGSAMTSLGTLYHKVPGWPISFGSDKKANKLLQQALKVNPNGIDPNYFYAEFLYDEGKYALAKQHLLVAQAAAPRPDRPIADAGRHDEIASLLAKVNQKL